MITNPGRLETALPARSTIMLYIIGLGLADERDISINGLEIVSRAERVYLEAYTAVLLVDKDQLVGRLRKTVRSGTAASKSCPSSLIQNGAVGKLLWPLRHHRRPRDGRVAIG